MTNTFTPAYVIARGLYQRETTTNPLWPLWESLSLHERNSWCESVQKTFEVMRELGYAVPDAKDKRK